jgi:hypothetical protein
MAVSKRSLEALEKHRGATQFSKDNPPKNPGRKPNILKRLTTEFDISTSDINNIFKNVIFSHTMGELQDMLSTKKKTRELSALETMIISACLQDIKKGSLMSLMQILDRVIGKPTQKDVIEFSDIPENAKDRLNQIFAAAQKKPEKTGTKTANKKTKGKKEEE